MRGALVTLAAWYRWHAADARQCARDLPLPLLLLAVHCKAEVCKRYVAVHAQHHVLGLQITVEHAVPV